MFLGLEDPDVRPDDSLHGVAEAAGVHEKQQRGGAAGPGVGRQLRLPNGVQLHPVPDRAPVRPHSDRGTPRLQGLWHRLHARLDQSTSAGFGSYHHLLERAYYESFSAFSSRFSVLKFAS